MPSAAQTYTVSGSNLTTGISITAPSGFELSTDGSSYSSNLTLAQSGGSVATTTIYVRLNSATEGTFSGNITHTSAGATQVDVPVSGVVTTTAPTCYLLTLTHTGNGANPVASPTNSTGCPASQYVAGAAITLSGAVPTSGWQIGSWTGTSNDSSTANTNTLSMPASAHTAAVNYTQIPVTCYALTLSHTGQGSDPIASPTNSTGCSAGQYTGSASITLTAAPAAGWQVSSWTGTNNNNSTATTNTVTMPANAHSASVTYIETPPSTGWTAYNDVAYASGQNTGANATRFGIGNGFTGATSGVLLDYASGASTGVVAALTQSGGVNWNDGSSGTGGVNPAVGTDAYTTFGGKTDVKGLVYYGSSGWYVDLTFTGLDSSKAYTFATTANRDGGTSL